MMNLGSMLGGAVGGDAECLDQLWHRTYDRARSVVHSLRTVGLPGSTLQATAAVNDVYVLMRDRGIRPADVAWALRRNGISAEDGSGVRTVTDTVAEKIFLDIVVNQVRSYLAMQRRGVRHDLHAGADSLDWLPARRPSDWSL